MMLGNVMNVKI
jgi:ATP-binding cassette subfamily B (MDR/TAP) protein 1